jgi:hypothetical protein
MESHAAASDQPSVAVSIACVLMRARGSEKSHCASDRTWHPHFDRPRIAAAAASPCRRKIARRALSLGASRARRHSPGSMSGLVRLKADAQARAGGLGKLLQRAGRGLQPAAFQPRDRRLPIAAAGVARR